METNSSIFIENGKYSDKWNLSQRNDNLETLKHSLIKYRNVSYSLVTHH